MGRPGLYQLQPGIAALHAQAVSADQADRPGVAGLYAELLALIDRIDGLDRYHLLHAARADLLRRLGRSADAASAYRRAHALAINPADDLDVTESR